MELSPIQNRLVEANLRRRHRFMEAQRHSHLLKGPTLKVSDRAPVQQITKILATIGVDRPQEDSEIPKVEPELKRVTAATAAKTDTMTTSGTIASAPETGFKGLRHKDHASSTATRITAITAAARYPRAKTSDTKQFSFKCPCCCQAIPAKEAEDSLFRKYLANDICPYTCILHNCPTPYKLFITQKEWKEHFMNAHPPKFQCPYCDSAPLSSLAEIMSQLQLDHPGISDDELADALTESPVHIMGVMKCPLCDSEGSPDSPELIEHVLEHIYDFSLRSLPWPKDPVPHLNKAVGTFNVAVRDVNRIIQWVYKFSPEKECQLQLCDLDINPPMEEETASKHSKVDYFAQNDYFMDESSDGRLSSQSGQSYLSGSESRQSGNYGNALQPASSGGHENLDKGADIMSAENFAARLSSINIESALIQDRGRLLDTGTSELSAVQDSVKAEYPRVSKRADVVGQVFSSTKRKESSVRSGLSKALRPRQPAESFEEKEYDLLSQIFGDNFFQIQVITRDVEMYTREIKTAMDRFSEIVLAIEGCIDVAQSNYTEIEDTWRRLRMSVQGIMNNALPEHVMSVRKGVIDPMLTGLRLFDGAQKVRVERTKRLPDYVRFKKIKDRGDLPDKKTSEQGEQFLVLDDALKDELPKIFSLIAKLIQACLKKFVAIQQEWYQTLQLKLSPVIYRFPDDISGIVSDWAANFSFADVKIKSLALCNSALSSPSIPRLSLDLPVKQDSLLVDTNTLNIRTGEPTASPSQYSPFFSSSMPMSDSSREEAPATSAPPTKGNSNSKVLFLAASLFEFNIDKSRREAGYPYLTYIKGEVFEVIAEKGELWLARNQHDPSDQVGWIWTEDFEKLSS